MGIKNDYLAYCFDEVAIELEDKATDKEGKIHWGKIRWTDTKGKNNDDLIEFAKTGK